MYLKVCVYADEQHCVYRKKSTRLYIYIRINRFPSFKKQKKKKKGRIENER
jgi:hypothetical protein